MFEPWSRSTLTASMCPYVAAYIKAVHLHSSRASTDAFFDNCCSRACTSPSPAACISCVLPAWSVVSAVRAWLLALQSDLELEFDILAEPTIPGRSRCGRVRPDRHTGVVLPPAPACLGEERPPGTVARSLGALPTARGPASAGLYCPIGAAAVCALAFPGLHCRAPGAGRSGCLGVARAFWGGETRALPLILSVSLTEPTRELL
mmetsp:Transcript_64024/g.169556  ORF Transcript_64024/g.169556 Transcript_64024/m.169556 type:complete len:205 (-) Transcript_64024:967-1581(-)